MLWFVLAAAFIFEAVILCAECLTCDGWHSLCRVLNLWWFTIICLHINYGNEDVCFTFPMTTNFRVLAVPNLCSLKSCTQPAFTNPSQSIIPFQALNLESWWYDRLISSWPATDQCNIKTVRYLDCFFGVWTRCGDHVQHNDSCGISLVHVTTDQRQ